ncbi:MAG: hypothetical protein JWO80_766 [Bryobacterales bacterium]|nr:hypothetical protein [Bryobacterales bacterium]
MDTRAFTTEAIAGLRALPSLSIGPVRRYRRKLSKTLTDAAAAEVRAIASRLLETPDPMHRFVAYELVSHHDAARRSLRAVHLEQLAAGFSDWASVDTFACYLSGPAWRDGQIGDDTTLEWANRENRWWRRAALVSTVALGRRGADGDAPRILALCGQLAQDRDDMVVKALSWALRELTKTDPNAVRAFLQREDLAARVAREVRNKLETGLKNPRVRPVSE